MYRSTKDTGFPLPRFYPAYSHICNKDVRQMSRMVLSVRETTEGNVNVQNKGIKRQIICIQSIQHT
jgi:hypothetical protein